MRPSHQKRSCGPTERQIAFRAAIESTQQNAASPIRTPGRKRSAATSSEIGHLRAADVLLPVPLRRDVRQLDLVEVDQLQTSDSDRRQLERDLPSDRPHADDGRRHRRQPLGRHQVPLPFEAVSR
jgi:hypothetical protein